MDINIYKLKPFNCAYYNKQTYLSVSNCFGYCGRVGSDENSLVLKYCTNCDDYIPKNCETCTYYYMDSTCWIKKRKVKSESDTCDRYIVADDL